MVYDWLGVLVHSRSRGRFSNNNNRTYGRRPEQVNGPSKDTGMIKVKGNTLECVFTMVVG